MASELKPVLPATLWQHYNGNRYEVLLLSNMESERQEKYPTTVVYRNVSNGNIYSRKLSDWHRSMKFVENTRPAPAATDTGLEPWGYGWFELGGKKMASGYLPTVNYPRSENVTEGPFPLYTRSQAEELLAAERAEKISWKEAAIELDKRERRLEAKLAAAEKLLHGTVAAWESLPGGRNYSTGDVQDWILGPMQKAINRIRAVLGGKPS